MNHSQKEQILKSVWANGTIEAAVDKLITLEMIHAEMKKSAVFRRRILEATEASKGMLIDEARALVRDYMRGKHIKTDRNRLTAAIALLNAYEPGFRGISRVEGRIEHRVKVLSAVPRGITTPVIKLLNSPSKKLVQVLDAEGKLLGLKPAEEEIN